MNKSRVLLAAAAMLSVSVPTVADEVTDQIGVAQQAYEAGNLGQAVDELQYAVAQIQEKLKADYVKLLPEPLAGWTADEAIAQSGGMAALAGGSMMSRDYRKEGGSETVSLQIMSGGAMTQAFSMMLSNPMFMQMDPSAKMYRLQGNRGLLKHDRGSKSWEISLMLRNGIMVQATGSGLADKGPVEAYLKAIDFKAVEEAFTK
jgi:hypothetical protein